MKRYRLSIALTTGLVAVLAILAASMFGGAPTRAEDTAPLFPEPAYTPTPALVQPPQQDYPRRGEAVGRRGGEGHGLRLQNASGFSVSQPGFKLTHRVGKQVSAV